MRLLLDNRVDVHAKPLFAGHEVVHVLDRGWDNLVNGQLIATAAAAGFQMLITVDKNLRYQQNLDRLPLSVLELDVVKNRLDELQRLAPFIPQALEQAACFRFVSINPTAHSSALPSGGPDRATSCHRPLL